MNEWKTHAINTVYTNGKWLTVEERTVETPAGQVIERWNWVDSPHYVNVLAETAGGQFFVFRQGKYGIEGESIAPVGGYIEPGEDPLNAAKRETYEETGCTASEWRYLGEYLVDPNRGMAKGYFYHARGAVQVTQPHADDLEEQQLFLASREMLVTALANGQVKIMAWTAMIAIALLVTGNDLPYNIDSKD